ncbi:MAG: hypothetical protein RMJ59_08050 [Candidatus Nitrosocaldus sp.]|nr:hypothetical protein [Candidatus Nitrosocaldus sp.]
MYGWVGIGGGKLGCWPASSYASMIEGHSITLVSSMLSSTMNILFINLIYTGQIDGVERYERSKQYKDEQEDA